jgi:hypothetical protein
MYNLVDVEVIGLQKIIKIWFPSVRRHRRTRRLMFANVAANMVRATKVIAGLNETKKGRHQFNVAKYKLLSHFVSLSKFIRDLQSLILTFPIMNHPVYVLYKCLCTESIRLKYSC